MVLLMLSGLFCIGFVCCVVFVACFIVLLGLCGFVLLPFGFDLFWILVVCVVFVSFSLLCLFDCVCAIAYFVYVSGFVLCSFPIYIDTLFCMCSCYRCFCLTCFLVLCSCHVL